MNKITKIKKSGPWYTKSGNTPNWDYEAEAVTDLGKFFLCVFYENNEPPKNVVVEDLKAKAKRLYKILSGEISSHESVTMLEEEEK